MAKSVTLKNGRVWRTQDLARKHFSDMLHRYKRGQNVVLGSQDHDDLLALLEIYDTDGSKAGQGIASFFLDADHAHPGNTSCFYVKRIDGTSEDFSVYSAVKYVSQIQNQKPSTPI